MAEGPENVFDGHLTGTWETWAHTHPPSNLEQPLVDYVYMQLTLDREYSDIYGFAYYMETQLTTSGPPYIGSNTSIYLSPTSSFFNGTACITNTSFTLTGTTPNLVNCTMTISNARYVTVVKYISAGNPDLHCNELQILRSGERAGRAPTHLLR